jgi:hypothetical protein
VAEKLVPGLVKRTGVVVLTVGAFVFSHALHSIGCSVSVLTAKCTNGKGPGQETLDCVVRNLRAIHCVHPT